MKMELVAKSIEVGFISRNKLIIPNESYYELWMTELQKWLRETYCIYVDRTTYPKFCYDISRFTGNPKNLAEREWSWVSIPSGENWSLHRQWECALEEGLLEAIKLI
jgi:hypothetical protein